MATSYEILETLNKHTELIVKTLEVDEKRQIIDLLSNIEQAEEKKSREDAVDELYDFCREFPAIEALLTKLDDVYRGGNRGKPDFDVPEDEQIHLFANRLIKATEESLPQDTTAKEKKDHDHD